MDKNQMIFVEYNDPTDIVRCPYGRGKVRDLLNSYAMAAVNLYGAISRREFIDIFHEQTGECTTSDELYILLLPIIIKNAYYCFYKDYIVNHYFFDDFEMVDVLISYQGDKPRYIPHKDEFLKYTDELYEDNKEWVNICKHMLEIFDYSYETLMCYNELKEHVRCGINVAGFGDLFMRYGLMFEDVEQAQELFDHIIPTISHTRLWANKGHTPVELRNIYYETVKANNKSKENSKSNGKVIQFPTAVSGKTGRNEPCPCGSGKKYKYCCGGVKKDNDVNKE